MANWKKIIVSGSSAEFNHITASGNISASGVVYADAFSSTAGSSIINFNDNIILEGSISASGDISSSGFFYQGLNRLIDSSQTGSFASGSDVQTNTTAISTNASGISTNASGISTNASGISTNASGISTNASDITALEADSGSFSTRVSTNETDTSTNTSGVSTNASDITALEADSGSFSTRVSTNESDITALEADSGSFSTRVSTNETDISTNASGVSTNASGISTNASGISTNASGISTNASGISTNASGISTNASGVSTNASGISTNASGISTNVTNITALDLEKMDNSETGSMYSLDVENDVTIGGSLTVTGTTTTLQSTTIEVSDAFIFNASGSEGHATRTDGGLVVQSGSAALSGSAIFHDISAHRWAVAKSVASSVASGTSAVKNVENHGFVVTVKSMNLGGATPDSSARATDGTKASSSYGVGEIIIDDSNDDIWILGA